jgi:ABC-type nitrate/sulfonate/bicarbonate transport system permease component
MQAADAPRSSVSRPLERSVRDAADAVYTSTVAAPGQVASPAGVAREEVRAAFASLSARLAVVVVPVLSIAAALGLWEVVVRRGLISEQDLPRMSATVGELWSMMETRGFWVAFGETVRGWALGIGIATALAVPIGIFLGSSSFAATAFRVPIEFLRPIPSAALIPLLFLTLGTTLKSEVFLATFGAFWPLLVQTMYGVRDVDPVAIDTARSFGVGRFERLYRITLPSSVPYIATGLRISSAVALILAFTAELFMGTGGLGQKMNVADSFGLYEQVYALALATGFLGIAIHFASTGFERWALRWHPSQRTERA